MAENGISLCMIARDEQDLLGGAIESARRLVSEIVVVDTGSIDKTALVATRYGATVLPFEWQDDFAAARNFALSHCTQPWVLVLDCDERLTEKDLSLLRAATKLPSALALVQRHYVTSSDTRGFTPCVGENRELEAGFPGYFESSTVRFFPRHPSLYTGRVHESVEPSLRALGIPIRASDVRIHHYGATRLDRLAQKSELYLRLGEQKIREIGGWQSFFELAIEYRGAGRLEEAATALVRSHRLCPQEISILVNLGCVLTDLGRYQDADKALRRAIQLNEFSADAHNNLGVLALRQGDLQTATLHLRRAVELHPWNVGAICNLARARLASQDPIEAEQLYAQALEVVETHAPAWLGKGILELQSGKLEAARESLSRASHFDPQSARARYYLGRCLKQLDLDQEASRELREFCRIERENQSNNYSATVEEIIVAVEAELGCA
jgi:Flp pilus assembly protein TadD